MNAFPRSGSATSMSHAVAEVSEERDFLPLRGTDHVEFFVGNARQAAYFYRAAFGMSLVAYAGPETGRRDSASYVVQQGKIRFVLTTPLRSGDPISEHIHRHGDGVRAIALWVDDARQAWRETTRRGAISVAEPSERSDEHGSVVMSSIRAYGDTIHTFVERDAYVGPFLPGFREGRCRQPDSACEVGAFGSHYRLNFLQIDGRIRRGFDAGLAAKYDHAGFVDLLHLFGGSIDIVTRHFLLSGRDTVGTVQGKKNVHAFDRQEPLQACNRQDQSQQHY